MPRIIVTTDPSQHHDSTSVLLDESVRSVHLSTGHAASQLVERLAWAISDAENAERAPATIERRTQRPSTARSSRSRLSTRQAANA